MKRLGTILSLMLAANLAAFAQDPTLEVQSGSASMDIQLYDMGNNVWTLNPGAPTSYTLSNGASFKLDQVMLDTDPSVHYAIGVTNTDGSTGLTPYTFTFSTPTNLTAGNYTVSSSFGGSLTDGGSNGVTFVPQGTSGFAQQAYIGTTEVTVADLLNAPVVDGSSPTTQVFGQYTSGPTTFSLGSTAGQISVTTSFGLSDNDSASMTGRFDVLVNEAPEPSSYALTLVAGGLFAVLLVRARRKKA